MYGIPEGIIVIQCNPSDNMPFLEECFLAYLGFSEMNYKCVFKSYNETLRAKDVADLDLKKNIACCVGNIKFVRQMCRITNKVFPEGSDYPPQLKKFLGRTIYQTTIGKLYKNINSQIVISDTLSKPVFVKPYHQKQFYTQVIKTKDDFVKFCVDNGHLYDLTDKCWVSSALPNIISEWRNYVHNGELVDSRCYLGDFTTSPNYSTVKQMIESYSNSKTMSYGLDVAVLDTGLTVLIETNPALCLGNYGLSSVLYCEMVINNWNNLKTFKKDVDITKLI